MKRLGWGFSLLLCLAGACEGTESGNPSNLLDGGSMQHSDAGAMAGHGGSSGKGGSGGTGGKAGSGGTGPADAGVEPPDAAMDAGSEQDGGADEDAGGATR